MISMRLLHSVAWAVGILAVMLAAAIAATPSTVNAASSECYSGVRVKSVTASPSTTRAGDGVVSMELIVENTERKDRQVWLKVTAEDPNGSEAKVWEWGPHIIPKTTGIWGFGIPGETHNSSSWAIPADASPGAYTMNALVLSEDKTQECDSKLEGASFTVPVLRLAADCLHVPSGRPVIEEGLQPNFHSKRHRFQQRPLRVRMVHRGRAESQTAHWTDRLSYK